MFFSKLSPLNWACVHVDSGIL